MFEVPVGGRRYRALELLVKQKRMAKTQLVPCVVRDDGLAEDDSLAENDETRHGAKRPVRGRGRIPFSRRRPDLVRRIPGHKPAPSPRHVRATCSRCAAPARRGPAKATDRTTEFRPWRDSSMAATINGEERKFEVQSLRFPLLRVRRPIRGRVRHRLDNSQAREHCVDSGNSINSGVPVVLLVPARDRVEGICPAQEGTIAEAPLRGIDFSSWQSLLITLIGLALFTLISIGIRLLMMFTIQQRRERMNRQINERLRTLVAAYKTLGGSFTGNLAVDPTHLRDLHGQDQQVEENEEPEADDVDPRG